MNCSFCGKNVTEATSITWKTKHTCLDCAVSVIRCLVCDELHHIDNMTYHVKIGFTCPSCVIEVKKCSCCGENKHSWVDIGDGTIICRSCLDSKYFLCETCSKYHVKTAKIDKLYYLRYSHVLKGPDTCNGCYKQVFETAKPKKVEKCGFCGNPTSDFIEAAEYGFACKEHGCADKLCHCYVCGKAHLKYHTTADGKPFCVSCSHMHFYCEACNEWHPTGSLGGEALCQKCAETKAKCRRCGKYHNKDKMQVDTYGAVTEYYCSKCWAYSARICGVCGQTKNGVIDRGNHGTCCLKCRVESPIGTINGYSYKPSPKFYPHYSGANTLYLGIENEITFSGEFEDDCWCDGECDEDDDCDCPCHRPELEGGSQMLLRKAGIIEKAYPDLLYNKRDGSVDNGFEVVSHPMTFDFFKQTKWGALFKDVNPSTSNRCCGMHIHMSKGAFSQAHLYKFMAFMNDNISFTEKIAERSENNYTKRMQKSTLLSKASAKSFYERYEAVNLTNEKTVEVRIFRGATKASQFKKNVEFVVALYEFTKKFSLKNCNLENFKDYVAKNSEEYPNLAKFIA